MEVSRTSSIGVKTSWMLKSVDASEEIASSNVDFGIEHGFALFVVTTTASTNCMTPGGLLLRRACMSGVLLAKPTVSARFAIVLEMTPIVLVKKTMQERKHHHVVVPTS